MHISKSAVLIAIILAAAGMPAAANSNVPLPPVRHNGSISFEAALTAIEDAAIFASTPVSLEQIGQLAWAAFGDKRSDELKTADLMSVFFVLHNGVYVYQPGSRTLERIASGDRRVALTSAVTGGRAVSSAPCTLVFAGKGVHLPAYEQRSKDVVLMSVGRSAGMARLQAIAMGLVTAGFDKIDDAAVGRALQLPEGMVAMHVMAVGAVPGAPVAQELPPANVGPAVLVVVPDRAPDEEYNAVTEALTKAGFSVEFVSIDGKPVRTRGLKPVIVSLRISDIDMSRYEGLIFLGGTEARQYYSDRNAHRLIREAVAVDKPVGAISNAPRILSNAGVLSRRKATANPSERRPMLHAGVMFTSADVVTDGVIVTAVGSAGTRFASAMVNLLTTPRPAKSGTR